MSFFDDTIQPKQAKKETPSSFFPSANVPVQTTPKTTVTRDLSLTPPSFSLSTPSVKTSTPMFSTKQVQPIAQPVPTVTPIDRALTQKPTTGFFAQVQTPEEITTPSVAQKPSFFDVMQRQEQIASKPVSKSKELFDKYAPPAVKYVANYLSEGLYGTGQEIDFAGNMQESKGLVQGLFPSIKSTYQKVDERVNELKARGIPEERIDEISKVYAKYYTSKLSTDPIAFINKNKLKSEALKNLDLTKEENSALNKVAFFDTINVALDSLNFTGVGSIGVKNIGKIIAKETYSLPIKNILMKEIRNIPENLADELSKILAKVNDPKEVEKIISKVDFGINKYKAPTPLADDVTTQTTKQTSLEIEPVTSVKPIKEGPPTEPKPEAFKGFKDLSTNTLQKLEGRSTVSKQFISDLTNASDLKQQERDVLREVLSTFPDGSVIPVKEFADKVKAELLPLNVVGRQETFNFAIKKLEEKGYTIEQDMADEVIITDKDGEFIEYDNLDAETKKLVDVATGNAETYSGMKGARYERVSLPNEQRGNVKNYKENVYESTIKTSAGDVHFSGETKNYFGHTRIEDMADDTTRRIIEVQSDLYQKGNLEKEIDVKYRGIRIKDIQKQITDLEERIASEGGRFSRDSDKKSLDEARQLLRGLEQDKAYRAKEITPLQQYSNPTAHFRMVREEIKKAAQDGKTKLQFPTGETAMKIEGLGDTHKWFIEQSDEAIKGLTVTQTRQLYMNNLLSPEKMKVGMEIRDAGLTGGQWIITDVLGDGKFKAVPKYRYDGMNKDVFSFGGSGVENLGTEIGRNNFVNRFGSEGERVLNARSSKELQNKYLEDYAEEFDISGKVDTNNPIYRFYEKDLGRYLTSKYQAKLVTDKQGVKWYEVDVKPEEAKKPVTAFKKPIFSKQSGPRVDIETAKKLIEEVIPKGKIRLAFRDELIKGGVGMYSSPTGAIKDVLKPLIELYEEGGKVEVDTLYHEAGHYLFDKILSNEEKMKALEVARKNISVVDRAKYFLNGYTGEANILEEYLMDEYAKQKTKEGGFTGPYKTIFERIDEVIRQIIDVAKKLYTRIKETVRGEKQVQTTAKYKRTGNAGEYDKPQSKEEKLKIAQEALEAGERRYALDDSKLYKIETRGKEDRLLVERGIQALNKQTKKESFLESLKITLPKELQLQKEALTFEKEAIQDNPARKLTSYMARRGQYKGSLPEVTGTGSSTFAQRGDDIVTELGYKDSEEAREAFDKYIESKKAFEDKVLVYQKDKQDFLNKARARRDAIITEKKVELASASTAKHIEELIGTKQNKEKIIKEAIEREKETQKRLVEEELQLNQYQEKVRQAQISERDKKTLLSKFKAVLSPISQTDNTTKKIYLDWEVSKLRSKEAGNKTYEQYKDKPENDLASIMEYEAGKQIRWIRDAFDDAYTQARRNDLGIRYKESYIPHVYNEKPAQIKEAIAKYMEVQKVEKSIIDDFKANGEIPEVIAIRLKIRPNFQKIRTFPDYATAMKYNLTPKFNTVAEHLAYYQEEMGKTLANKKLIDDLIAEGKILDAFDAPESWIEVKLPGRLRRSYYAQKNLADALNGQFRDEDNLSLAQEAHKRLGNLSQFAQSSVLTGGVPETTINNFAMGQAIRMLTTGVGEAAKLNLKGASSSVKAAYSFVRSNFNNTSIKWFKSNQKYIDLMVDNNVPLFKKASDYDQNYKTWKNLLSAKSRRDARISLKTVGKDIVGIRGPKTLGKAFTSLLDSRAVGLSADIFNKSFSDKTFSNMMPQMQIQIFKDIYEGAVKDGVPSEEAAKFSANIVRNEFGMANDLGRTQNVKDVFNSYFFAPRFREGMVNIFINGAKAWTTEFKNPTFARSRSLIVGMIITYIMYNFLNKQLNDGDDMWENEPGREFALKIPLPSGRIIYTDFMPSSLAFVRNIGSGSLAFLRGDSKTAGQKFGTLFSIPIKIATEIAGNKDYFGRPIYEITDTLDDKIKKSAEHIGLGIAHPYIRELTKYFEGKQDIYQTVSMMMELPLKFSTEEKSIIARSYEEKNAKASLNAQERAKINDTIEIYDNVQKLKTEGNTGAIETLIDGMSEVQYQEYKMIMKYEEIQALKKAKNTEEATRIGDSLTDQEYLQYQAIKTIRTSQKREVTGQKKIDAQKKPVFDSSSKLDERTVMESVKVYANAIGTDPVTAFNRIFTGQRIRYTAGGAIVVERMPLFESQKVKSERGATSDLKLDHTLPLSLGGSNDEGNLKLVPVSDWKSYTPVETHLSRLLKSQQISKEEAQKLILDFKRGEISADSILKL